MGGLWRCKYFIIQEDKIVKWKDVFTAKNKAILLSSVPKKEDNTRQAEEDLP